MCSGSFSVFTALQLLCFDTRVLSLKKLEQSQYQLFGMIKKESAGFVQNTYNIQSDFTRRRQQQQLQRNTRRQESIGAALRNKESFKTATIQSDRNIMENPTGPLPQLLGAGMAVSKRPARQKYRPRQTETESKIRGGKV